MSHNNDVNRDRANAGHAHNSAIDPDGPAPMTRTPLRKKLRPGEATRVESTPVMLARRWGWGALVIPVVAVLVLWLVVAATTGVGNPFRASTVQDSPFSQGDGDGAQGDGPHGLGDNPVPSSPELEKGLQKDLPKGGPYTEVGEGTYRAIGRPGMKVGEGKTKRVKFVIEAENGLDTNSYGGDDAVSTMIDSTLSDPRSWTHDKNIAFEHIDIDDPTQTPDLRIQISSPETARQACGDSIKIETSCFTAAGNRVVLNEARWVRGSGAFNGDLGLYREYMINHEVGHGIGYAHHKACEDDGGLAPIMMQQTLGLANNPLHKLDKECAQVYPEDNKVCKYNAWPYPQASKS